MSTSIVSSGAVDLSAVSTGFQDICALSPLQREIISDPNHGTFAEQALWECPWPLHEKTLHRCWQEVVQRHPILRSVFRRTHKQPVQMIRGDLAVSLTIYDVSETTTQKQDEEIRRLIVKDLDFRFDLANGPLFRLSAFRLSRGHFQTLLTFHPIILDRQSVEVIHAETAAAYPALLDGNPFLEGYTPVFKDFLLWLNQDDSRGGSRYWQNYLANAVATRFPFDAVDSAERGIGSARACLDDDLTSAIDRLARQSSVSVTSVLQSAWALLLFRWLDTQEVVYGLVVPGRPKTLEGAEEMVGKFSRILPFRVRLQPDQTLEGFLRAIEQQADEVNRYSHLSLPETQLPGAPRSDQIFNTVFADRSRKAHHEANGDLRFLGGRAGSQTTGLSLEVMHGKSLEICIRYEEALVRRSTVVSLLSAFQQALASMVSCAGHSTENIDILRPEGRARVLGFSHGDAASDELWTHLGLNGPASVSGLYVLDRKNRLQPVGCFGEIAVGSVGSEGASASENSIPNSFVQDAASKLWRTGQRARWTHEGRLEFALALDLMTAEKESGDTKVDDAPSTEIEKLVAEVWREVLTVPRVGLGDDFFDLGGHSLQTIQVRSRLSQRLGINLPLKTIFSNTRLKDQVRAVAALQPGPSAAASEIPRLPQRKHYPVSYAQGRLWFLHRLDPDDRYYHTADHILLEGPLNLAAFRRAFHGLAERQDILRTGFRQVADEPVQCISEIGPVIPFHDLSALGSEEQAAQLKRLETEVSCRLAYLERPPVGSLLIRLAKNKHVFILAIHHILSDEWSGRIVWRDLMEFYSAACRNETPQLPPIRVRYVDFAVWQKERIERGDLAESERYWLQRLDGPLPKLQLSWEHSERQQQTPDLLTETVDSGPELDAQLMRIGRAENATRFMVMLTVFKLFLARITGQEDILVGGTTAGRDNPDIEPLIGLFVNVVALRTKFGGDPKFSEALKRVRQTCVEAYAHQEYPFDLLVQRLAPARDANQLPILEAFFSYAPYMEAKVIEGVKFTLVDASKGMAVGIAGRKLPVPVCLVCQEMRDGHVRWRLLFQPESFSPETARRLARQFESFLASLTEDPETPFSDLSIVSVFERDRVLNELAGPVSSPVEAGGGIVARIEDQARRRPQATAVSCGSDRLTYEQLNQGANRLGHWLRLQGIGRASRIGIFGSRSPALLTTLLAVLKAGAAFVPLDPEHPDTRIEGIIEKTGITLLATSAELTVRCRELAAKVSEPLRVICWHDLPMDSVVPDPAAWASHPVSNLDVTSDLGDLAYVCHTSGSTGMPKGAMIEHRGMLNHLLAKISFLGLDHESVVAQNASHCFDISVWQFFAALLVGGRVFIYPPETLLSSGSLLQLINRDEVTVLESVPSLIEMMLNQVPCEVKLERLEYLISNAELLPVPLCLRLKERFPHIVLVNTYGATECSDDTTHQIVGAVDKRTERIPVGRSIPGAQHYVLDRELHLVPAGCVGQIAIAGKVVGRGYLADPVATAQAFVPDPFHPGGHRLYLTGDLGRWNSAGELEFLGRTDNQIKIHGHRVELGEIEAALGRLKEVRQIAVILSEEGPAQRLVAYWVGEPGADATILRDHARNVLPPYMVPGIFVQMPALPLTANGKVDRQALPKPADVQNDAIVPPRDHVEFKLAGLWCTELGVSAVGVFDNFFERGGHSLKAVSLINRIQAEFKINLPLRALFDHQTIDSLGRVIRDRCRDADQPRRAVSGLVSLQPGRQGSSAMPLFLVHPHGGTVFCYQALAAALGDQVPVFGIQCRGLEEAEQPLSSIPDMAAEYNNEIFKAQPQGPYFIAGWSLGGLIAFEMARQLEAGGHTVALLAILDSAIPSSTGRSLEQLLPDFPTQDGSGSEISLAQFARWFFRADHSKLENLSDAQIIEAVTAMAQRAGMLPPDVSPEMMKRFVLVAISSGLAFFNYRPANPVETNVVLFRAAQSLVHDPNWWAPWTRGQVETVPVEGTHYDMVFPPAVQLLASELKKYLHATG